VLHYYHSLTFNIVTATLYDKTVTQLKEASTHKSVKTHAGNVFCAS